MILFMANPDRYTTATLSRFWHGDDDAQVTSSGYDGRPGWIGTSDTAFLRRIVFPTDTKRFVIGARFHVSTLPASPKMILCAIDDASQPQASVVLKTDGTLALYSGDAAGTELAVSVATVNVGTWNRIAFQGVIDRISGSLELQLNSTRAVENIVADVSGVNTSPEDSRVWSGVELGLSANIKAAHLYALDGTGGLNSIIPDALVQNLVPLEDGTYQAWVPNTGASRFAAIDDAAPDDAATYIKASVANDDFSVVVTEVDEEEYSRVYGAQATFMALSSVTPQKRIKPFVVSDGSQKMYAEQVLPSTYAALIVNVPLDPATSLSWTPFSLNNVEWGARLR